MDNETTPKPILIDALHICMGGGLMILNHLINNLVKRNVEFALLKDSRCPKLQSEDKIKYIEVLPASFKVRRRFYKDHGDDFGKVLCFGNIPPSIRLKGKVLTYYHNVSLLKTPADYSLKWKMISCIKRIFIKLFVNNTDVWIAQTTYTASLLNSKLVKNRKPILVLPFYFLPSSRLPNNQNEREDYIFIGEYTNAKGQEYLLEAWRILHQMGFNKTLHLTITDPNFCDKIKDAKNEGIRIVNHGHISFNEVLNLYQCSKATIYPSLNESLGLGIVEAIESGCDVIGVDLPYMHSVCKASTLFNSRDPNSIVKAVLQYEKGCPPTELLISDMVNEFIDLLID